MHPAHYHGYYLILMKKVSDQYLSYLGKYGYAIEQDQTDQPIGFARRLHCEKRLINRLTCVIITTNVIQKRVMSEIPKISEAEWEVMKIVWSKDVPCTANEIVDVETSWSQL